MNVNYFCLIADECGTEMLNMTNSIPVYISSPNYNLGLRYPNDIDCQWFFTYATIGTYIVTVIDLQTEYFDTISAGFGGNIVEESKVALLRETTFPATILLSHKQMWIRFTSNHAVRFRGFLLEVKRTSEIGIFWYKFGVVIYLYSIMSQVITYTM